MPDTAISGLNPAILPLTGNEPVPIVQAGETVRVSGADLPGLFAMHRLRPPWARKIASDWRTNAVSSGACTAASLRAQPYSYVDGLTITGLDYYVQGSITSGSVLFVGIYDADPATGLPTTLLWETNSGNLTTVGSGNKTFAVSPNITGKRAVWIAHYISSGSTTQFGIGASNGLAHLQMGVGSAAVINAAITSLLSNSTWAGSMPSTLGFATDGTAVSIAGTVPLFNLVLAAP